MPPRSPYEAALGERLHELHPTLRRYFSAIPDGCIGVGEGVFAEFGTPRRWLWPLLRPFERRGVLAAGYARSVRFRIVNRTEAAGTPRAAAGAQRSRVRRPAAPSDAGLATAIRTVELPTGTWQMTDSVALTDRGVVDRLGAPHTVAAAFDVEVRNGGLFLSSREVGIAFGRFRIRLPRLVAPVVRLSERYDPVSGLQRVELTIDAPLVGRVYGYCGHFSYGIVREKQDER